MFVAIPPRQRPQRCWLTPALAITLIGCHLAMQMLDVPMQEMLMQNWGAPGGGLPGLASAADIKTWLRLFSGLFLHTGWPHLLGNLVFLLIFGLPAERLMGAGRLLLLFLLGGAAGNWAAGMMLAEGHVIIGASGAVSAVLGAWLALFPRARLGVVLPLGIFMEFVRAPAALLMGIWAVLQLLIIHLGKDDQQVAWLAHLAGFSFGILYALLSRPAIIRRIRKAQGY